MAQYYVVASGKETDVLTTISVVKCEGKTYRPDKDAVIRTHYVLRSKAADKLREVQRDVDCMNAIR